MKNVLIPPIVNWDFLRQLPQQMASQFAKNGYNVLYCNQRAGISIKKVEVNKNLMVYPNWDYLNYEINRNKIKIDIVYNTAAMNHKYIEMLKPEMSIYHSCDSFDQWKPLEGKMLALSDLVCCTSKFIYDIRKKEHKNVHLVRNGCNEEYINMPYEKINSIKFIKQPICVFSGACGQWVKTSLIKKTAEEFYTYFVGTQFGKAIPKNVNHQPTLPHNEMMHFIRSMNVGLLPFNTKTEITQAANPIKMWEYLASGLPVMATSWDETTLAELNDVVFTSETDEGFINNIIEYSNLSNIDRLAIKEKCYEVARNNTWEKRFETINDQIIKFFGG